MGSKDVSSLANAVLETRAWWRHFYEKFKEGVKNIDISIKYDPFDIISIKV